MAAGPFTWFNQALLKIANNTILLTGTSFKVVLTTSTQALSASFNGTSGNCQYSDLTAELATANGYTNGGLALANETLSRSTNTVTWTADNMVWSITSTGIACRYAVIYDDAATNKDLLCFCDLDPSIAGNVTIAAGPLWITPSGNGILKWNT